MSSPIEDYALIGDGQTAALVNRNGSLDWLCWPQFDSDACFAALLGTKRHGFWSIAPTSAVGSVRRYEEDTLVLETETDTPGGKVRLTDFMPIRRGDLSSVVRIVEAVSAPVDMRLDLRLRFAYGTIPPWIEATERGFSAEIGPDRLVLDAPVRIEVGDDRVTADFTAEPGRRLAFVLSYSGLLDAASAKTPEARDRLEPEQALAETRRHWRDWIGRFDETKTRWPRVVKRSLITLKAMAHHVSGGLVAAPTTSLPEAPAGTLNWDYRYCWLRDSSFMLSAFLNAGFVEEATQWRDWLLRAVAGSPEKMQIMYRLDGGRHLDERTIDGLPGWRDARPVRVGNAAANQHQLDVYGEVLVCLSLARRAGMEITRHQAEVERRMLRHLEAVWHTRGSGIWESRGEPRQYTYSKAMAWAGLTRVLQDAELPAEERERLDAVREEIHASACLDGWNTGLNSFTQSYGSQVMDASLLLIPLVRFLPADDPRIVATVDRIGRELSEGGLIRRQARTADGPNEGAFLACSCWMADCLYAMGREAEAVAQFERLLAVGNDVGLFAEEYDVPGQHLAGNFPQALTHLAIVNTALRLSGQSGNDIG